MGQTKLAKEIEKDLEKEMTGKKPKGSNKISEQSNTVSDKKDPEAKKTIVEVALSGPKYVWNRGIVPLYNGAKGAFTEIKKAAIDRYEAEKQMIEQMGGVKYALDRTGTVGVKLLKLAGLAFGANLLNTFVLTKFGVSLFAPSSLLIIGAIALICFIVKSVMTQRASGQKEVDGMAVGSNVMESFLAAA
jgi:hypothetical protein